MTAEDKLIKLEEKFKAMKVYEEALYSRGLSYVAGIDEVGRGPLAGPVIAAAVVLPKDFYLLGIDDSKKLSEKKRLTFYNEILKGALAYGIGCVENASIDEMNILNATKAAMLEAVGEAGDMLVDKNGQTIEHILVDAVKLETDLESTSIIKGDAVSISIAAASIVAKVTRDRIMENYDIIYPGYKFASNKGYGTKAHYEGIDRLGMCPIHRKTFLKNYNYK